MARPARGVLALLERGACQGSEGELGVDLVEAGGRRPAVLVGFEELAAQAPGLGGQALAGELAAGAVRLGVGRLLPDGPGRYREHGDAAPAERPPGERVGVAPAVGQEPERHVDPDDARQR